MEKNAQFAANVKDMNVFFLVLVWNEISATVVIAPQRPIIFNVVLSCYIWHPFCEEFTEVCIGEKTVMYFFGPKMHVDVVRRCENPNFKLQYVLAFAWKPYMMPCTAQGSSVMCAHMHVLVKCVSLML